MSGLMRETSCPHCGGLHPPGTDACPGPNLAGRTLAGGVHVLERLRLTSQGSLYRAEVPHTGTEVELITLRPDASWSQFPGEKSELDRLWDQLSRARGINHPNIASVKGMGRIPEGPRYIALEALRGELLSEILDARGVLPLEEAVDLTLQAASGLQVAHEAGLLHGSLSPASILVTRTFDNRPLVKLIRFGLAHKTAPPVGGRGSTGYTAPERLAGNSSDERSDIFSLGAVLYHLLTGAPPSGDPGEAELIPGAARPVVSKALEPLPRRRYGTVAAFARALEAVRDESEEQEERAGGGWRGVAAVAAGFGIVAAGFWLLSTSEQPRPQPGSERRVTVSGAAPTAPDRSPRAGNATPPRTPVARRKPEVAASERAEAGVPTARTDSPAAAAVPPENFEPSAGAAAKPDDPARAPAPVASGPADSALGYSPGITDGPPAPAAPSLTRTVAMRLALSDVMRLDIVADYEEVRPGHLVLVLGDGYRTSTALEYNLRRLYAAYVELLQHPLEDPLMELWQNGRKVGEYTRQGLEVGPEYVAPR